MIGVLGGVIGAMCCIGPAVGVAFGVGSGSILLGMGRYRPITFAVGALFAGAVVWFALRRRRGSCSTDASFRALSGRWIDAALIAFAATYAFGRFVLAPVIEHL